MLDIIIKIIFFSSLLGVLILILRKTPVLRTLQEVELEREPKEKFSFSKAGSKMSQEIFKKVPQAERAVVDSIKAVGTFSGKKISHVLKKIHKAKKNKLPKTQLLGNSENRKENFSENYWENFKN